MVDRNNLIGVVNKPPPLPRATKDSRVAAENQIRNTVVIDIDIDALIRPVDRTDCYRRGEGGPRFRA